MQIPISCLPLATKNRPKEEIETKRGTAKSQKQKTGKKDIGKFLMTLQGYILQEAIRVIHLYTWPQQVILFYYPYKLWAGIAQSV